jgi:hypothetical protein
MLSTNSVLLLKYSRTLQKNKSRLSEEQVTSSCISVKPEWNSGRDTWLRFFVVLLIPSRKIPEEYSSRYTETTSSLRTRVS